MESKKDLDVMFIIKKAAALYKGNAKLFIGIIGTLVVLNLLMGLVTRYMPAVVVEEPGVFTLLQILITLITLYLVCRVGTMLIYGIDHTYRDKKISVDQCFIASKSLVWKYFGTAFLVGLIYLIPIMFIFIGRIIFPIYFIILLFAIGAIFMMVYIAVNYSLAPFVKVLYPNQEQCISYTKELVEGNKGKIFIIILLVVLLDFLGPIVGYILKATTSKVIIDIYYNYIVRIVMPFIMPFTMGILTLTVINLKEGVHTNSHELEL